MKCTSRSITLLASLFLPVLHGACILIDGGRIQARDLVDAVPAFGALPPEKDLGPAPTGTLVRIFHKTQLAALLNAPAAEVPDSLCVQRRREPIPVAAWQAAVESAMSALCPTTPCQVKVLEFPQQRLPIGELHFPRGGLITARDGVSLWRGALTLADKTSVPVWVRADIRVRRRARVLQHAVAAGAVIAPEDFREDTILAPGLCTNEGEGAPTPAGMIARHAMPEGAELRTEHVRRPPAVVRGQPVEIEAAAGAARIRIPAVAEQDGDVGEKVQVRSSWNGSKLVGRVTGSQKAKVE